LGAFFRKVRNPSVRPPKPIEVKKLIAKRVFFGLSFGNKPEKCSCIKGSSRRNNRRWNLIKKATPMIRTILMIVIAIQTTAMTAIPVTATMTREKRKRTQNRRPRTPRAHVQSGHRVIVQKASMEGAIVRRRIRMAKTTAVRIVTGKKRRKRKGTELEKTLVQAAMATATKTGNGKRKKSVNVIAIVVKMEIASVSGGTVIVSARKRKKKSGKRILAKKKAKSESRPPATTAENVIVAAIKSASVMGIVIRDEEGSDRARTVQNDDAKINSLLEAHCVPRGCSRA